MKKLFFSLLAVAAMASCSKSELAERPNIDGGDVEILAKSTALSISTRAPFEGSTIDADHNLVAKVWATTMKDVYSGTLDADGKNNIPTYNGNFNGTDKMVFKNENQVGFLSITDGGKGSMYFPADKDDVYLFGLYPYDLEWTESTSAGKSSAVCKIDGKSDIMVAPQAVANKAKHQAVSPATPEYPTLAFEHMLTKLIVKVSAENDAAISAWGQITEIALTGANGGLKIQVSIACTD
ncbi:MAG: fimbrillin family protein, partial [Alistipes sp.]|nr:fimbrillin family protein [Alistipes sp.]